jgi:prophage tail gpP-like protein
MLDTALTLLAAGRVYAGWKSVRVVRSMQQCASAFELTLAERWAGQDVRLPVRPGTFCAVMVGQAVVLTGYVDGAEIGVEAKLRNVSVAGRDMTADLVDCSAIRKPGQWRGAKIEAIARDLCAPFGVRVVADVDTGAALASFSLQAGETVFEALERAARLRALLLVSNSMGALVLTRAGIQRSSTPLLLGQNVLKATARLDMRDRFSTYTALGQAAGSDNFSGALVSQIRATAIDPGVSRYRPLVVTNSEPDLAATLKQRVLWEANVRAARSLQVTATVQGWAHDGGLWAPNTIVPVRLPAMDVDEDLLLTDVEYLLDEGGTTSELTLTRADAYRVLPLKQVAGEKAYWTK